MVVWELFRHLQLRCTLVVFFKYVALNYGRDKISRVVQTAYFNLGEINSLHYTARVIFVFLVGNLK